MGLKKNSPGCRCCEQGCEIYRIPSPHLAIAPPEGWTIEAGVNWKWGALAGPGYDEIIINESNAILLNDLPTDADSPTILVRVQVKTLINIAASKPQIIVNWTDDENYHYATYYRDLDLLDAGVIELHAVVAGVDTKLSQCGANWRADGGYNPIDVYFGNGIFAASDAGGSLWESSHGGLNTSSRFPESQAAAGIVWVGATGTGTRWGLGTGIKVSGDKIYFRDRFDPSGPMALRLHQHGEANRLTCPQFFPLCWWVSGHPIPTRASDPVPKSWQVTTGSAYSKLGGQIGLPVFYLAANSRVAALTEAPSSTIRGWTTGYVTHYGEHPAHVLVAGDTFVVRIYFNANSYGQATHTINSIGFGGLTNSTIELKLFANGAEVASGSTTANSGGGFGGGTFDLTRQFTICYDGATLRFTLDPVAGETATVPAISAAATLSSFVPGIGTGNAPLDGISVRHLRGGYDSTISGNPYCDKCSSVCDDVLVNSVNSGGTTALVYLTWNGLADEPVKPKRCAEGVCAAFNGLTIVTEFWDAETADCEWIYEGPLPVGPCSTGLSGYRASFGLIYTGGRYYARAILELLDGFELVGEWRKDLGPTKPNLFGAQNIGTMNLYQAGDGYCNLLGSTVTWQAQV